METSKVNQQAFTVTQQSLEALELLKKTLDEEGVAVLPNVLTTNECDDYISQIKVWLAKFGKDCYPDSVLSLVRKYNLGFHPVAWLARLKSAPVFEYLWGTEKLLSSISSVGIGVPPEVSLVGLELPSMFSPTRAINRRPILHLDQGPKKVGLHAYQAALYLEEAEEDDWCFAVISRSHHHHVDFFKTQRDKPDDEMEFTPLREEDVKWYEERGCEVKRIAVPKGGMVFWDSRLVHAGAPPFPDRKNPGRWRYVLFVCMAPAQWASEEDMANKKYAYKNMIQARHWPAQAFEMFPVIPVPEEHYAVTEIPEIAKTEKAQLLAGVLEYDFNDGKSNGPPKPIML